MQMPTLVPARRVVHTAPELRMLADDLRLALHHRGQVHFRIAQANGPLSLMKVRTRRESIYE